MSRECDDWRFKERALLWDVKIYSNEQETLYGCELWVKGRKIFESECTYSKEGALEMAEELKTKFGIKNNAPEKSETERVLEKGR